MLRLRRRWVGYSWELICRIPTHGEMRAASGWSPSITTAKLRAAGLIDALTHPDAGILEFSGEQLVEFRRAWDLASEAR